MSNKVYVPVIIDEKGERLTRAVFYTIESYKNSYPWHLGLGDISLEFIMLGLSGIIVGPIKDGSLVFFHNPYDFEEMYNSVEKDEKLYISISSIYIPNDLIYVKYMRDDFFRVDIKLFLTLLQYQQNWSYEPLKKFVNGDYLFMSSSEKKAYDEWRHDILNKH
ncbi:hypothetical protein [Clostridium omnivorum]|uniref:Uncharacterized protein n=1 Tax=Clostridium omnivorum TaxID=1604902 RepID=A0ABQ5N7E1_9CLOT|nr:hypothetical protein [Clostridium sp. E14]GLC31154.1 hypothetical protein bsdE14_25640 [Clostridium sp. E14]